jgi:hypothetical protein
MRKSSESIHRRASSARHRAAAILLSVLTAVGLTVGLTSSVAANPLDGSDPGATGCSRAEHVIQSFSSQNLSNVTVQLLYSSSCSTAWARITCTFKDSSGCGPTVLSIVRMNGSPDGYARYDQFAFNNPPSGSTSYFWTDQVYDGGNNRSQACINLDAGSLLAECSAPF